MNESMYRGVCAAMRTFDQAALRLRESQAATRDEQALLGRMADTLPALCAGDLSGGFERLTAAFDRLTAWRTTHLNVPIPDDVWAPVFMASQEIRVAVIQWAATYPRAYREAYLGEEPETDAGLLG